MTPAAAHAAQGTHPGTITVILLALAIAACYASSLYFWPHRNCPRCRGARVSPGSSSRRFGMCKRCSSTGRTRRHGAAAVHRFCWSVFGDARLRERRRADIERRQRQARSPETYGQPAQEHPRRTRQQGGNP
jgi:hypothetical protein